MSRKKQPIDVPSPVLQGDVFATFVKEATLLGNEVVARRTQGKLFQEYLILRGMTEDFEAWKASLPSGS